MLGQSDYLIRCLVEERLLDEAGVERARRAATDQQVSIEDAIVALGLVSARDIGLTRAILSECPFVDLNHYEINIQNALLLPRGVAERSSAFPLFTTGGICTVGMIDPLNLKAVDQLRQ